MNKVKRVGVWILTFILVAFSCWLIWKGHIGQVISQVKNIVKLILIFVSVAFVVYLLYKPLRLLYQIFLPVGVNLVRWVVTGASVLFIILLSFATWFFTKEWWAGFIVFLVLMTLFVRNGINVIVPDPPHKGVLVFLSKRYPVLLDEGWCWLPLSPYIFNAIPIPVVKINRDFPTMTVRTPDTAEIKIAVSITFTPGKVEEKSDREKAQALIAYLNSGEEKGVLEIIEDVISDTIRHWAFSTDEGPATWKEAVAAGDDARAAITKAVLGNVLPSIHSSIPTRVLLRYFASPQLPPLNTDVDRFGKNWEKLKDELNKLSADELKQLKEEVEERRRVIKEISQGNGKLYMSSLGITLHRLTLNSIVPSEKISAAIDRIAQEKQDLEAEAIEIGGVIARVMQVIQETKVSPAEAIELVQLERKKLTKDVKQFNLSPATVEAILRAIGFLK